MRPWMRVASLVRGNVRQFTTSISTSQKLSHFGTPLSAGLTSRFIRQKDSDLYYYEDLIIELLRDITREVPVPEPEVPYLEMADRPWRKSLPIVPNSNLESLNSYVQDLTSYRYDPSTDSTIEQILLKIVSEEPGALTKKSYVGIVARLHFMVQDQKAFKVIDQMMRSTDFNQDIDFENQLLAYGRTNTEYRLRATRLENIKNAGKIANTGTWYSIFRMFKSDTARLKMLDAMDEYGVSVTPVLKSASHCLSRSVTPDMLLDFYERKGIIGEKKDNDELGLSEFYLNRLVECHLKGDHFEEAYNLLNGDSQINQGTFAAFIRYFIRNGQIANCFPFSNLFHRRFSLGSRAVLNSILVTELPYVKYFDNWDSFTRILVDQLSRKANTKSLLPGRTIKELNNYAKVHGVKNFNPFKVTKRDIVNATFLFESLKWKQDGKLHLDWESNSEDFRKAAKWFGQYSSQDKETLNPSNLL